MKTTGLHDVTIICSDYDRSKKIYIEVLGFSIIQETFRSEKNPPTALVFSKQK